MERNGYPEETYYTFSYTPITGNDGRVAGMICANTDDTDRIISERQLRTLNANPRRKLGIFFDYNLELSTQAKYGRFIDPIAIPLLLA